MAFTNNPLYDTNSSHRSPLVYTLETFTGAFLDPSSNTAIKQGMYNVLPAESEDKEFPLMGITRPGIQGTATIASTSKVSRGFYVWEKSPGTIYYFIAIANSSTGSTDVYTSSGSAFASVMTLTATGTGVIRFTEFIDDVNTKKLVMVDGTDGYVFTSDAAGTRITDADFPTPHVPFPVFMDGYLFLAKTGTGDIYNSDLNDPAAWTAGNFISSELYPDDLQALWKINNYILAIGTQGCEYFQDAGNAIGSPLARQEGASLPFGTSFPNTIAGTKDTIIMLANNNDGSAVFKAIEGFKYINIDSKNIVSFLNSDIFLTNSSAASIRSYVFRLKDDTFYTLKFGGGSSKVFCYSTKHKMWSYLSQASSNKFSVDFVSPPGSVGFSITNTLVTYIVGQQSGSVYFGTFNGDFDTINGVSSAIENYIIVPEQTYGTLNRKFMYRLGLSYNCTNSDNTLTTLLPLVRWTNVRGGAFNDANRLVTNASTTAIDSFPFITQLGSFRGRSFQIYGSGVSGSTYASYQWYFMEVDINKGQR